MRIRMYIAAFYGVAAIAVSGFAEAMNTRSWDETIGGQLETVSDDGMVSAEVLLTDLDVRIRDDVAEIHLRQVFSPLRGTGDTFYLLPVSPGTEIIAMEITQGAKVQHRGPEAAGQPTTRAYMFSQNLTLTSDMPVDITLIYRQPVRIDGDVHSITLPVATASDSWASTESVHPEFEDMPEYLYGESVLSELLDRDRIDISVSIDHPEFREIYSDSHAIDVTAIEGGRIVELAAAAPVVNRAFTLSYVPEQSGMTQVANVERNR